MRDNGSMKTGLVSVVMPVYNQVEFVKEAIKSVLNQGYKNLELIVVDDCSSDGSGGVVRDLAQRDERIKIVENGIRLGVARSLNVGIEKASGEYVARMDADDVMVEKRLESQVEYLKNNPEVVVVGSWVKEIDGQGQIVGERRLPLEHEGIRQMMFYAMGMQHPTLMFNRKLIDRGFGWYQEIKYAEDLDLLFRLMRVGKLGNIGEYLVKYRVRGESESFRKVKQTFKTAFKVRKRAVSEYGYVPGVVALTKHYLSWIVVMSLPSGLVMRFYSWFRRIEGGGKRVDKGVLVLGLISLMLAVGNWSTGSWLVGWDALVPELNWGLSLKRSLSSVWQEYRGLGVYDGMAHAANLVHGLWAGALMAMTGVSKVRFWFHVLAHFFGGLGVYHLVKDLLNRGREKSGKVVGLVAAGFYMLNIGTVQMFFTPLEVFSYHFAALPILSLWLIRYLKGGRSRDLAWFGVVSFFGFGSGLCTYTVCGLFTKFGSGGFEFFEEQEFFWQDEKSAGSSVAGECFLAVAVCQSI